MALERTCVIIKPDAYKEHVIGEIISMIEKDGFKLVHTRLMKFTEKSVATFYFEHKEKDFYDKLLEFMCSDKALIMVLEKEKAVSECRKLMGDTDPVKAKEGTIRNKFGTNHYMNAVHGSDSLKSAKREITYFFGEFASIPSSEKGVAKEY